MLKLQVTNLNSTQKIKYKEHKIIALSGILSEKMKTAPVYLVDEQTMDKLYPPQKRKLLNEECLKEFIKHREKRERINEENVEEIFERCSKEFSEKSSLPIAIGLYLRKIPDWLHNQFNNLKEPAVFICPERCIKWGNSLNIPADFVFTEVLFHEYAHAYLDVGGSNDYYNTSWGKIIEESLANYIAYTRFESIQDKENVIKLISDQPLEYRCSLVFIEQYKFILPIPLPFREHWYWKDIAECFYYFYRRYGTLPYGFGFNLHQIWKEYKEYKEYYKNYNDERLERFFKHLALNLIKTILL